MPAHIHMIAHAVAIATVLLIVAYFVLVAAERSAGFVKGFGTLLAIWLFVIAAVLVAAVVTAPMFGGKPFGLDMPPERWMRPDGQVLPAPPPSEPAPTQPETPPAPAPAPSGG